jgi:hypothetical protein
MRSQEEIEEKEKEKQHTTPRTLLSLLRLSQAVVNLLYLTAFRHV